VTITPENAEEYTQALGQITAGAWRQIALAERLGVPAALGLSTREWVDQRLGGYVRLSISERREAVAELTSGEDALSIRGAAEVLGVGKSTVERDLVPDGTPDPEPEPEPQVEAVVEPAAVPDGTAEPPTLDQMADQVDDGSIAEARLRRDFHAGLRAFTRDLLPLDPAAVAEALTDDDDRYAAGSLSHQVRGWLDQLDRALHGLKVIQGGKA
jgi:hypothetical protein